MVKVCLDVDYRGEQAVAAGVLFHNWQDDTPLATTVKTLPSLEPYVPGQFYRRELPCLCAVLHDLPQPPELILVDGYVWLTQENDPGLGGHLFEHLNRQVPVIGVAKTRFLRCCVAVPVQRGQNATRPLFVTAAGMDVHEAARLVQSMHGPHRLPTLLRQVDALCRRS